jgi:hypothetical protein
VYRWRLITYILAMIITMMHTFPEDIFLARINGRSYATYASQAVNICKACGFDDVATYRELYLAWTKGLDYCACGWIRVTYGQSTLASKYPINKPKCGCGGCKTPRGIRTCTWRNRWNVWCVKNRGQLAISYSFLSYITCLGIEDYLGYCVTPSNYGLFHRMHR